MKRNDGENFVYFRLFISLFKFIEIEWTDNDIHVFTEALEKFPDDWTQIANYVRRSEQSCRAFYQQYRKKNGLVDDERVSRFRFFFQSRTRKHE